MNVSENNQLAITRMMIEHAKALQIHSGNIINWNSLKKGLSQNSSEELLDAVRNTLTAWQKSVSSQLMSIEEPLSTVDIANSSLVKKFDKDQREKIKISVKIFLTQWKPEHAKQAVQKVCQALEVQSLDSVLISFPFTPLIENIISNNNNDSKPDFQKVKPIWKELEHMVDSGRISHLGVTDFDRDSMEELYNWARVKPTIDQIGMSNCCTVPEDLIEFSKNYDIELLSHNDAPEILTARSFQDMMEDCSQDMNSSQWNPTYVARYSVIVRCRGIVEAKGYVVGAERRANMGQDDYGFF